VRPANAGRRRRAADSGRGPESRRGARPGCRSAALLWCGPAVALAACSFAPAPETPATVAQMPASFDAAAGAGEYDAERWWRTFDDPALERLVDKALVANLDLRQAVARLEELRHRYRIARASLFPSVSLNGEVSRSSSPANTGLGGQISGGDADSPPDSAGGGGFRFPDRFEFTTYSASLGFAYELDFWGRARNESSAAVREFLATRADLETARISVIAATISTYFEIAALREQLALAEETVDLLGERAEITEERYRRGLVGSFELYSIRQEYRTAQADLPGLRSRLDDAEGRLAVLLGRFAGSLDGLLPDTAAAAVDTSSVPAALPVSLLEGRPDVLAAFERMEAARHRVGARRAELLPTVSLNGSVGFQSSEPEDLFRADQWFLNLVGGIFAPLFEGGRLRANVGVAEAQYEQQAIAYVRAVLDAYREVRTSLRGFEHERERVARVTEQVEEAEASLEYQLRRYRSGVGDYVSYLDARRNLAGARTVLSEAERGLAEARLGVHRALGGAWVEPDEHSREAGPAPETDRSRNQERPHGRRK